ncbi:MAG: MFS transporter [Pirellulales bacterium]|nr:MFS transporter [Pirellulales bacterium]
MSHSQLPKGGRYRWAICALLFFATTINYIDRAVIAILKPDLIAELHWNEIDYSNIIFWFSLAYAIGYAAGGWFLDRVGVRRGYAIVVFVWSLAAIAHGFNRFVSPESHLRDWFPFGQPGSEGIWLIPSTVIGFSAARLMLGIAEGGNFPAAVKSVSEWFPKKERAFATGIFNAGSNIGVMIAPIMVPWLAKNYGWETAFYVTGALGFLWLAFWLKLYYAPQDHPRMTPTELAYIRSDPPDPPVHVPWLMLLRYRQVWAFITGMFLSSPIWWFYLYWVPGFLYDKHGVKVDQMGWYLVAIYLIADLGSIGGGWLSSRLIEQGWSVNAARKTTMLCCALCVTPVCFAASTESVWVAVLLIGLAASAHQGFSANLYTLVSDTAPRSAVSSIVGIGGMVAGISGMFNAKVIGYVLEWTGKNYNVIFVAASFMYLINLAIMHAINPRLMPMKLSEEAAKAA